MMFRYSRLILPALLSSGLLACQLGPYPVSSPYFIIPNGSSLVLKQALTIPADSARVYFQDGRVIEFSKRNQYQPNCSLLLAEVKETEQHVQPGEFSVISSRKLQDVIAREVNHRYAMNTSVASDVYVPMLLESRTELRLRSETQPHVYALECMYWDDASDAEFITVAQIQQALGEFAELKIKQ